MMKPCSICSGKLEDSKKLIIKNGKTFTMNVKQCVKCGHSFSNLYEIERLRPEVNPSMVRRLKTLFSKDIEILSFFKGRVL